MVVTSSIKVSLSDRGRTFPLPPSPIPMPFLRFTLSLEVGSSRTIMSRSRIFFREPVFTSDGYPHTVTRSIFRSGTVSGVSRSFLISFEELDIFSESIIISPEVTGGS